MQLCTRSGVRQRRWAVEECGDKRRHRHDLVAGVDGAPTNPDAELVSEGGRLSEEARLTESRPPVEEHGAASAVADSGETLTDH